VVVTGSFIGWKQDGFPLYLNAGNNRFQAYIPLRIGRHQFKWVAVWMCFAFIAEVDLLRVALAGLWWMASGTPHHCIKRKLQRVVSPTT
jgi:hypothetical protein